MKPKPLGRPEFGSLPERRPFKPQKDVTTFKYYALLQAVRQHPNSPAKVAEIKGPNLSETRKYATREWQGIRRHLDKFWPDEHWGVHQRRVAGTWAERGVWVIYYGIDPEAAAADRQRRLDQAAEWVRKGQAKKAARAAEERRKAIAANEENRRLEARQR